MAQGGLCLEGTTPSEQGKWSSSFKSLCSSHIPRSPCHKAWGPYPSLFSLTALWFVVMYLRVLLLKRFFPISTVRSMESDLGLFLCYLGSPRSETVHDTVHVQLIIVEQTTAPMDVNSEETGEAQRRRRPRSVGPRAD